MFSFLFFISFSLHIITIIIIYQLVKKINNLQQAQAPSEIMEIFDTYLQEVKAENEYLQQTLTNQQAESSQVKPAKKVAPHVKTEEPKQDFSFPVSKVAEDRVEASLQARILQLHEQGNSIEEIAKQLDCGKTEAELIIKLHAKK